MQNQLIEKKLNELPEKLKEEALDFINFLIIKNRNDIESINKEKFNFNWEGGLADFKNKYTSVNLQHASMEWR